LRRDEKEVFEMKKPVSLILSASLLAMPLLAQQTQPQPVQGVDEYNMGLMDGQNAVNNDGVMYGVYACLGQTILPPLGVIPVVMAMSSEPGVSGYPRMNTPLYMQGYYQGTQTKKASVKSARTGWAIGGCLLGSAITAGIWTLYFVLVLSEE
jgi:hypothetical protein